ncbi:MAG: molybdenum cofactor guanylyltransferase, partial [bacterium]
MNEISEKLKMTAVILAGGKSTRFGQDKAAVTFGDTTLLGHIHKLLNEIFEEVLIAGGAQQHAGADYVNTINDVYPDRGPLGGIHTGLVSAKYERCFVTACDTPFLKGNLIRFICSFTDADVVIPRSSNGKLHPLAAVYAKSCLAVIKKHLTG